MIEGSGEEARKFISAYAVILTLIFASMGPRHLIAPPGKDQAIMFLGTVKPGPSNRPS
jgi:hypothetical protein